MTTYKELQEVFNIPKSVVVEAQLKTMPDDIINLVCEFMPSYLKDIKSLKIDKKEEKGFNINLIKTQKLFIHHQAKQGIAISMYKEGCNCSVPEWKENLPLYPLPITPTTMLRSFDGRGRNNERKEPYIGKIRTYLNLCGDVLLEEGGFAHDDTRATPTGILSPYKLQHYYSLAQLDNIAGWYKLKVPSKIKKNKTKYIQYLMKQEF